MPAWHYFRAPVPRLAKGGGGACAVVAAGAYGATRRGHCNARAGLRAWRDAQRACSRVLWHLARAARPLTALCAVQRLALGGGLLRGALVGLRLCEGAALRTRAAPVA